MKQQARILFGLLPVAIAALIATGCEREEAKRSIVFNARAEGLLNDDSKVLFSRERYIMWEYDDEISIGSDKTSVGDDGRAWLYHSGGNPDFADYNGTFLTTLPGDSRYFLGLHPCGSGNQIGGSSGSSTFSPVQIELPATQTYRNDTTFDKQVYPMVAWYGGEWSGEDVYNLNFKSLGSIVRVQLLNNTGAAATLTSIEVTATDSRQVSGLFNVTNYKTNNPYLTPAANTTANQKVTIDCSGLSFPAGSLKTFYLVLPALTGDDEGLLRTFSLKVNGSGGNCTRSFRAGTRRRAITYMQALSIDAWNTEPSVTLSGNGTEARPFRVYTLEDLQYLRSCYNGDRKINGITATTETRILIMRGDIRLKPETWASGINNFVGHISYAGRTACRIVNNSGRPLFTSVGSGSTVEGITVYYDTAALSGDASFSPFCGTNDGTITGCAITSGTGTSGIHYAISGSGNGLGGICVTNNGTISASECTALFYSANNRIGGICLENYGTVEGCHINAGFTVSSTGNSIGGIVGTNYGGGTVRDCYYDASNTSVAGDWGCIAQDNKGTLLHCFTTTGTAITTTGRVGGISVGNSGTIERCWNNATTLSGTAVGGIVASQGGGSITNSYCNNSSAVFTTVPGGGSRYAGGIVGELTGGTVSNSFSHVASVAYRTTSAPIGGVLGTATSGTVDNCYTFCELAALPAFFGTNSGATLTNCHLIGGSQTSVSEAFDTPAGLDALRTALDTRASAVGAYTAWVADDDGYPILAAYSISKRRR